MTNSNTLVPQDRSRDDMWRAAHGDAGQVAPHEGRELELLASGQKDFAVIEQAKNPLDYSAASDLAYGHGIAVVYHTGPEGPEVVLARRLADLAKYSALINGGIQRLGIKEYHRQMGRLFGYSEADIEAFISAEIHCDCSKCRGA